MKQLIRLFVFASVLATCFAFSSLHTAQAATPCVVFQRTNSTSSNISIPVLLSIKAAYTYISIGGTNLRQDYKTGAYSGVVPVTVFAHSSATLLDRNSDCSGTGGPLYSDSRLNKYDGDETAAVYCENGGVSVYSVVNSVGSLAFKVTEAELDAVPAKPATNTLIKSGLGVALYRLTTGELQINAPDNYVFTWDGCAAA